MSAFPTNNWKLSQYSSLMCQYFAFVSFSFWLDPPGGVQLPDQHRSCDCYQRDSASRVQVLSHADGMFWCFGRESTLPYIKWCQKWADAACRGQSLLVCFGPTILMMCYNIVTHTYNLLNQPGCRVRIWIMLLILDNIFECWRVWCMHVMNLHYGLWGAAVVLSNAAKECFCV